MRVNRSDALADVMRKRLVTAVVLNNRAFEVDTKVHACGYLVPYAGLKPEKFSDVHVLAN